jgi:hypothetical protein
MIRNIHTNQPKIPVFHRFGWVVLSNQPKRSNNINFGRFAYSIWPNQHFFYNFGQIDVKHGWSGGRNKVAPGT